MIQKDGLNYGVGWDCESDTLIDATSPPSEETCIWANGCLVRRFLLLQNITLNS